MRLFDADQDGALSADEIAGAAAKLKEFDKNKDGKLNDDELRGALPFGRGPRGSRRGGPPFGPGGGPGAVSASDLQKEVLAQNEFESRILTALGEMREGPRFANVSHTDGRLLRLLAEAMDAKRVVEIGTSTGESAAWLALAVESTGGHVYTHEIDEGRAKVAKSNFKKAGIEKLVTLVLGDAHETVKRYKDPNDPLFIDTDKQQWIDVLFLDADKEGYIDYMEKLMPLIRPGGLIVAHNMNARQADARFVKAITEDPALETLILLKEGTGVGVTLKKR
jgi:predicted O-methyltransferase YrrM